MRSSKIIDIHGFVEYDKSKVSGFGGWEAIITDKLCFHWNALFAKFFGQCNSKGVEPLFDDRGFPSGVSWEVMLAYYENDGPRKVYSSTPKPGFHSKTYVYWYELKPQLKDQLKEFYEPKLGYEGKPIIDYRVMFDLMEVLGNAYGDENVRWIVWFENEVFPPDTEMAKLSPRH